MASDRLGWIFDTAASNYAQMRPGYVDELYRDIFSYAPIDESSEVVEVGIGGGQATLPFLQRGCTLTAVEYGKHFSEICREKFEGYDKFSVITGKFEETEFAKESFDLIYSASAFHWVPEEIGYPKVFSMLKGGGVFVRFANHPFEDKGRPQLADEIQKLYKIYMPYSPRPVEYGERDAKQRADIAAKYGFKDIGFRLYHRTRTFSAKEYVALLGTYSDHLALERGIREEFFSKIEELIDEYGGQFTLYDTIDLQLARKPRCSGT